MDGGRGAGLRLGHVRRPPADLDLLVDGPYHRLLALVPVRDRGA